MSSNMLSHYTLIGPMFQSDGEMWTVNKNGVEKRIVFESKTLRKEFAASNKNGK